MTAQNLGSKLILMFPRAMNVQIPLSGGNKIALIAFKRGLLMFQIPMLD